MVTQVNLSISAGCTAFLKTLKRNVQNKNTLLQFVPHSSCQLCAYKSNPGATKKSSFWHKKFSHQTEKVSYIPTKIPHISNPQ